MSIDEAGLNPITKAVLTMVAEVERLLAAQRTRFAMRALKLKGKTFGTVPFGYRRNADGGLDPQPGEIEIVYKIVSMRANGSKLADIASHLTGASVPTRRGGKWSAEQVRSILERAKTHSLPQLPGERCLTTSQPVETVERCFLNYTNDAAIHAQHQARKS